MHWLRFRNKLNLHFFVASVRWSRTPTTRATASPSETPMRLVASSSPMVPWCRSKWKERKLDDGKKTCGKKYEANAGGGIWMILEAESWTCWWETCGNSGGKRHDPQATRAISMQARWASGCLDGPAGGPGSTKVCGVSTSAQFGSMLYVCVYIYMCVCVCV